MIDESEPGPDSAEPSEAVSDEPTALGETDLRPSIKPWFVAAIINLLLATVLLGIPYYRGPRRAREVPARFAAFTACLYDATALDEPGLGLPRGERRRFGSLVLTADPEWPARCRSQLRAIPAEETMFLFPSVKNAEAALRDEVAALDRELAALARARAGGVMTVPSGPMDAFGRVRGILAELGLASNVRALRGDRDAVELNPREEDLPVPSIVPIRVEDGPWSVGIDSGVLVASASEPRGIVHVRVANGRIDFRLTRRPPELSAMLSRGSPRSPPWLAWTTDEARCGDSCATRSTGLAAFLDDRQTLEPMFWLGAHPAGDPERVIQLDDRTVRIIGRAAEGVVLRTFELPEPVVRELGATREPERVAPSSSVPWPDAPSGADWAWVGPYTPAYSTEGRIGWRADGEAHETHLGGDPIRLASILPARCTSQAYAYFSFAAASERGAVLVQHAGGGRAGQSITAIEMVIRPPDARALQVVCAEDALQVFALADRELVRSRCVSQPCPEEECQRMVCAPPALVASHVTHYDVAEYGGQLVVAWTGDRTAGAVHVQIGDDATVISPCWHDSLEGLCGDPRVTADDESLYIVTRSPGTLRSLQYRDEMWSTLPGLEQR